MTILGEKKIETLLLQFSFSLNKTTKLYENFMVTVGKCRLTVVVIDQVLTKLLLIKANSKFQEWISRQRLIIERLGGWVVWWGDLPINNLMAVGCIVTVWDEDKPKRHPTAFIRFEQNFMMTLPCTCCYFSRLSGPQDKRPRGLDEPLWPLAR